MTRLQHNSEFKHVREPAEFGHVGVLMGGRSAEREVSLKSGSAVLQALKNKGVDATGIDVDRDIIRVLQEAAVDRVVIMLHGRGGEDGVMQATLEMLNIPYTGSGVLGSLLSMDKLRTKEICIGTGVPTPEFCLLDKGSDFKAVGERLGFPVIVKPVHEGSSIGISKVMQVDELESAWKKAAEYDPVVIAERWVTGSEYTVSILQHQALPVIRLETSRLFYDYEAKYESDSTQYHCPCGLDKEQEKALQERALQIFGIVDASGWGRVDFMLDESGVAWLIEVNTVPGMTDHSLVPMAARVAGIGFDDLVWKILETSCEAGNG